jgi:hypothetical protein
MNVLRGLSGAIAQTYAVFFYRRMCTRDSKRLLGKHSPAGDACSAAGLSLPHTQLSPSCAVLVDWQL